MPGALQRTEHERWLLEVTGLPTAAGREDRVIQWVRDWVGQRDDLRLRTDQAGNLIITRAKQHAARDAPAPTFITAHLDHPAFVITKVVDEQTVEAEFRGGVDDPYFESARIDVFDSDEGIHTGRVEALDTTTKPFKTVTVRFPRKVDTLQPGDVGRWAFRGRGAKPEIHEGILHTPACDDLAAVAAALSVLDTLRSEQDMAHVGVLLTRAEEVGFIGAIAACRNRAVPKKARLICLENSRSFAESPIGGGPILRVGDKTSVFAPDLTNRIGVLMAAHEQSSPGFKWQRRLMPGGTCEATTFSTYGWASTCLCLPLGNYHNMRDIDGVKAGERPARVGPEFISVADYHGLIEMLIVCCQRMDDPTAETLEGRMERLFAERQHVLG